MNSSYQLTLCCRQCNYLHNLPLQGEKQHFTLWGLLINIYEQAEGGILQQAICHQCSIKDLKLQLMVQRNGKWLPFNPVLPRVAEDHMVNDRGLQQQYINTINLLCKSFT